MTEKLRVASFNLESLDETTSAGLSLEERAGVLRPQLARLDADLLCLQEVNAQRGGSRGPRHLHALDALLKGTSYESFERAISLGLKGEGLADRHNLVILSRWPIRSWRSLRHHLVPPPTVRPVTAKPIAEAPEAVEWDRPVLHASIALPGDRDLHLVNLHLRAPLATPVAGQRQGPFVWNSSAGWAEGFFLSDIKRAGQALEARLLIDEIFDFEREALIAVCGDFNAREHEIPVRIITAAVEDTGSGALASRELIAVARGVAPEQRFTVLHAGDKALYDHILISRSLYAGFRRIELHNEALADEGAVHSGSPFSFHAPLVAEFVTSALAGAIRGR